MKMILRRTGFSKVGKHRNPQIYLGLLVGLHGFAIGYDIFEGNIFEGHTLLPTIQKFEDSVTISINLWLLQTQGLLSKDNIIMLQSNGYQYIIGARIKNESQIIKDRILEEEWEEGHSIRLKKGQRTANSGLLFG